MKSTLQPGLSSTERIDIDRERTIEFLGEDLRVYSTPSMVRDVEYTSLHLLDEHLDPGESSVGMHVAVDHLGATPLGETVEVIVKIVSVDGRKIELEAEVRDRLDVVGRGRHVRFVIDVAKQAERVAKKKAALAAKSR
jgi:fluoroacetyl-CoA thioesterase